MALDYNQSISPYVDSCRIQMSPLAWSQNAVNNVVVNVRNVQHFQDQQQLTSVQPKDPGGPSLRMLIDEVDMLVQQVEENISSEKVHEFMDATSNTTQHPVTSLQKLIRDKHSNQNARPSKRRKKFEVDKDRWRRNCNKRKRMIGIAYESLKKINSKKFEYVLKGARQMGPPCNCPMSKKSKRMMCNDLDENERETIFNNFWKNMSWGEKKVYISTLVEAVPVKQRKTLSVTEAPRRDKSLIFHLMKGNVRIRVCKTMFLNTLHIGEWSVRHWVESASKMGVSFATSSIKRIAAPSENRQHITNFLKILPTISSPHCKPHKKCLEPVWQSINEIYREYVKHCTVHGYEYLSHTSFRNEFSKLNYSLYKPKKDIYDSEDVNTKNVDLEENEVLTSQQTTVKEWHHMEEEKKDVPHPSNQDHSIPVQRRAKRFEVDETSWKRNSNKRKRMSGIAYESLKKQYGKYEYVKKDARKMGSPCNCSLSKRSSKMKCNELTESDRNAIFDNFWKNMTWNQKKGYVASLVEALPVKQHRASSGPENSRRDKSLIFHLPKNNIRVRVCKIMFLNTLAVGEWSVRHWVLHASDSTPPVSTSKRSSEPSPNKQRIIQFLKLLPTLQSQYSDTKCYLEPSWQSIKDVYRAYIKHCTDNGYDHLSHTSFRFEFAKLNYALYKPK
ncbi:hypothetical protein CHUAL_014196 [Chamberlinius hualienensis]